MSVLLLGARGLGTQVGTPAPVTSRQAAFNRIVNRVVRPSEYRDFEVFATPAPLPSGTSIGVALDSAHLLQNHPKLTQPIPVVPRELVRLTAPAWLLFADLHAGYRFEHPAKVMLVRASDGQVTVHDVSSWPTINGKNIWMNRYDREQSGDRLVSRHTARPHKPIGGSGAGGGGAGNPGSTIAPTSGDTPWYCTIVRKFALTISASAEDDPAVDPAETDNLAAMFGRQGYTARALKQSSRTNGESGWDGFQAAMNEIATQIRGGPGQGYCSELTLVWAGHGAESPTSGAKLPSGQGVSGTEGSGVYLTRTDGALVFIPAAMIVATVEQTTNRIEGMQVRVMVDTCHSGMFPPIFQTMMPPDPNEKSAHDIIRDMLVIASSSGGETAAGSSSSEGSFTAHMIDCLSSPGVSSIAKGFDCAKQKTDGQTPEARHWWNNGA